MISVQKTESDMDYIAYLHKDRDSDFGVSFPDFPGCVTAGKTLEEARRMAVEALALHIAGMIEDGDVVPDPSNLDALRNDPNMRGAVAVLVSVEPAAEKTVRINITARQSQVEAIDQLAGKAGLTRSAYMVQSSLHRLGSNISKRERTVSRRSSAAKGSRKGKHSSTR